MGETGPQEFPMEFQPQCYQFRWMLNHLGGWQFGEQELIPALLDVIDANEDCGPYVEIGAGDGDVLPLTIDRMYAKQPGWCRLVEVDDERRALLKQRYPKAACYKHMDFGPLCGPEPAVVVIDIDGLDSVVMRDMLDSGCRPSLIVCEHMDRHYSIGTTAPNPIPEWLLGTITEHGHTIQDTAETLHWMAAKYGYERIGFNRCNSFFVRKDLFPLLFR